MSMTFVALVYSQEMLLELAHDDSPVNARNGVGRIEMTPVEQLYTTFQDKKAALWKCDGWYSGIKWRIPRDIDCTPPLLNMNRTSKEVQITLYWTDISKQTVNGFECYGIRQVKWAYTNFVNRISEKDHWETYIAISEKDCWNMINLKVAPDLSSMAYEKNGIFGTYKPLVLETAWWSNKSAEVTNFFVIPLTVAVLELDESVKATVSFQRPCFYNESSCETEIGLLVWKSSDVKECRLQEGETSSCIYTIDNDIKTLTCPDLQLSLHDLSAIEMCGVKFGTSSQNVYFSQGRIGEIDSFTVTPDKVRSLISSPKKKNKRKRRSAFDNLDSFVNARSNFITDTLINHTETYVRELEAQICHVNQRNLHLIKYMAQSGHPTLIPRFFLGEEQYRATFCGDGLSIWQCNKVHSYKFLTRTTCTREWPVRYIYEGMELEGWVSPLSHVIVNQPTELPEPCDEYYFDTGDHLLQLTNFGPQTASLPTLPVLGEKIDHSRSKVPLSFKGTTGINIGKYTDEGHSYTIWQQFAKRQKHFKELKKEVKEIKQELTFGRVVFETLGYAFDCLPSFAKYMLGFGILSGIAYGLVVFMKYKLVSGGIGRFSSFIPSWKTFSFQRDSSVAHNVLTNDKDRKVDQSDEYDQPRSYAPCAPLMPNILPMAASIPPPPPARISKRKSK